MSKATALILPFLQLASSLVIGGVVENAVRAETADIKPFPPTKPVSVDLQPITAPTVGVRLVWVPVKIGDREYKLELDTGSVFTWVMTDKIYPRRYRTDHGYPLGYVEDDCEVFTLWFADKSAVDGVWTKADVTVAEYQIPQYQVFAVSEILNDPVRMWKDSGMHGMFGAGVKAVAEGTPTPWLFGTPFTVDINQAGRSTLTFGDTNYKSDMAVKIDSHYSNWVVDSPDLGATLVDTGVEVLLLPPSFVGKYMANIKSWAPDDDDNKSGTWMVECETKIPDIQIDLGVGTVKIPSKDFREAYNSIDPKDRCRTRILFTPANNDNENGKTLAILGMPFFRSHIVTFDGPGNKVGITAK